MEFIFEMIVRCHERDRLSTKIFSSSGGGGGIAVYDNDNRTLEMVVKQLQEQGTRVR